MDNIKQTCLNYYFSSLNPQQLQAVLHINGPLLVLSGAGSGKTTVIVNRIVNMILFGDAYELFHLIDLHGPHPFSPMIDLTVGGRSSVFRNFNHILILIQRRGAQSPPFMLVFVGFSARLSLHFLLSCSDRPHGCAAVLTLPAAPAPRRR